MRTTIEISDEHRSKLLEAAAKRGEKGFSTVVREALAEYFNAQAKREGSVRKALAVIGSLSDEDASELEEDVRKMRLPGSAFLKQ